MVKLYTGCMNQFLQDHCQRSNIITTEQVGGKKEVWGCPEQLLINKIILEEITENLSFSNYNVVRLPESFR